MQYQGKNESKEYYRLTTMNRENRLRLNLRLTTIVVANTGIVNVLVSTLYSKPDEVTGYECGLYSIS